jgi:hypothetical protein
MLDSLRRPLAPLAAALLLAWTISVAGATGWGLTVNWTLFLAAGGLLVLRALA